MDADVIVVGGGAAGLSAASCAARLGSRVTLIDYGQQASGRASGYNEVSGKDDFPDLFFQDTMLSGRGLCDPSLVAILTAGATSLTRRLASLGMDVREVGKMGTRLSGGSSVPRTVFAEGEGLGAWLVSRLRENVVSSGVCLREGRAIGARIAAGRFEVAVHTPEDQIIVETGSSLVLTTGGAGQLYQFTTNYGSSRGDGYHLGLDLGASLVDMEFAQFEPFIMAKPDALRGRGVPINLVADGGRVLNSLGEEFIPPREKGIRSYTKDELSQIIFREVLEGRGTPSGCVYCDISKAGPLIDQYHGFKRQCAEAGVDPTQYLFEIVPAYHCLMGGLRIDAGGATSVEGVFAAGEGAGGVHGANRLGSSGLTDALVFGEVAGRSAALYARRHSGSLQGCSPGSGVDWPGADLRRGAGPLVGKMQEAQERLRSCMQRDVGIVRSERSLIRALNTILEVLALVESCSGAISSVGEHVAVWDTNGLARIAWAIAGSALRRRESRGVHLRSDYPSTSESYLGNTLVRAAQGTLQFGWRAGRGSGSWE